MTEQRRISARRLREDAAALAAAREHPPHQANRDEPRYACANYLMSFSKGLGHDPATGLVTDPSDFEAFRTAIDNGFVEGFTRQVPVPRQNARRKWEAPTAGLVYDLQGPDAQAVTMPPAPSLCSAQLTFEMAEVYELALLRDEPLASFEATTSTPKVNEAVGRMNLLAYAKAGFPDRPRKHDGKGELDPQTVFRGSSPGVEVGPYLSQLMLIGTDPDDQGFIDYGAQRIDQRVKVATSEDDYMMDWGKWHAVQQGYEVRKTPDPCKPTAPGQDFVAAKRRFIYTPRDLATYVHVDQLYQAYLNACLILLGNQTPFDPGFDLLSGHGGQMLSDPSSGGRVDLNAGGFALWGGPHVLSLLTEVATRGLKAVRFQKFNNHLRLRPEALAARIEKATEIERRYPTICGCLSRMEADLAKVLEKIRAYNAGHRRGGSATALLPMAFEEGSPMHPAYGAGHATVAGACVTILKAFFDTSAVFVRIGGPGGAAGFHGKAQIAKALKSGCQVDVGAYRAVNSGVSIEFDQCGTFRWVQSKDEEYAYFERADTDAGTHCCPLTLEGELNKLAANISIGRNMAGVHYFSDYYDSLRMGEQVALGILEEQALCYPTDPCVMSVPTFDGGLVRIGRR